MTLDQNDEVSLIGVTEVHNQQHSRGIDKSPSSSFSENQPHKQQEVEVKSREEPPKGGCGQLETGSGAEEKKKSCFSKKKKNNNNNNNKRRSSTNFAQQQSTNNRSSQTEPTGKPSKRVEFFFESTDRKLSEQSEHDPDVDGGYALVILLVMFLINASTYGTARAYGLIFEKSVRDDDTSRVEAAIPFTIMGALENMSGPLAGYMLTKFQSWRLTVLIGTILVSLSHLMAAYFESLAGRILTMGIICGFGTSLITISSFQINNAYFVRYRSRAFGFGLTGAAFGTLYISPLCQYVLSEYSINTCYIVLGLILLPNVPLSLLLKVKPSQRVIKKQQQQQVEEHQEPEMEQSDPVHSDKTHSIINVPNDNLNQQTTNNGDCIYSNPLDSDLSSQQPKRQVESSDRIIENNSEVKKKIISLNLCDSKSLRKSMGKPKCHIASYNVKLWSSIGSVLSRPIFHLIWPTQLIFCWFNFVFGMIIVDFAKDRGLNESELSYLIPTWALGQLVGRLILGAIVDLEIISYKSFTVICLSCIGLSTWSLQNLHSIGYLVTTEGTLVIVFVLILSIFISNLYILFNGLVAIYIERELTAMSIGISSFITSFFLLPRAHIIGYYRDTLGEYDQMLDLFTYIAAGSALIWLCLPPICELFWPHCFGPRGRLSRIDSIMSNNNLWLTLPSKVGTWNKKLDSIGHKLKGKPNTCPNG